MLAPLLIEQPLAQAAPDTLAKVASNGSRFVLGYGCSKRYSHGTHGYSDKHPVARASFSGTTYYVAQDQPPLGHGRTHTGTHGCYVLVLRSDCRTVSTAVL